MKEKLIDAIHSSHNDQGTEALTIVDNLRCDKCRYWVGRNWETLGECTKLTDSPAVSINDAYSDGVHTKPDFFCALWEAK